VWQLKRSVPATGVVRSRDTGEPIPNATFHFIRSEGDNPAETCPPDETDKIYTRADSEGRFSLSNLTENPIYVFLVRAPGYRPTPLRNAASGVSDLVVEMGPEIVLSGRIIWPAEVDYARTISYETPFMLKQRNSEFTSDYFTPMEKYIEVDQKANTCPFRIEGLWEGKITLNVGGKKFRYDVTESMSDLVIDLSEQSRAKNFRQVFIRLEVPEGMPKPSGSVMVYVSPENESVPKESKQLSIDGKGETSLEVPVPCSLYFESDKIVGYWFKARSENILPGESQLVVPVETYPAGSIYGQILEEDGTPAKNSQVSLIVVERAQVVLDGIIADRGKDVREEPMEMMSVVNGKYNASPLPFGGKYQIVAAREHSLVAGQVVTVDEKQPIHEINLTIPKGISMRGKVEFPDGLPASGILVALSAKIGDRVFYLGYARTDETGYYTFEGVNAGSAGEYAIAIDNSETYQPVKELITPKDQLPTVRFEKGQIVTGRILENGTDYPIPGVIVRAHTPYPGKGKEQLWKFFAAESPTNEAGEFRFSNLGTEEYTFQIQGVESPAGVSEDRKFSANDTTPIILRVIIPEWSDLKAVKPPKSPDAGVLDKEE
jgi:hypothetical protein